MAANDKKILQMIPNSKDAWIQEDGKEEIRTVVCWALVAIHGSITYVVPMVSRKDSCLLELIEEDKYKLIVK